jgi:hypothetical protein
VVKLPLRTITVRVPFGTTPTMMRLPEVGSSEVFAIPWRSASPVLAQTVPMVGDLGVVATTQRFSAPGTSQYVLVADTGTRRARLQLIPGIGSLSACLTLGGMPSGGVRSRAKLSDSTCDKRPSDARRKVSFEV